MPPDTSFRCWVCQLCGKRVMLLPALIPQECPCGSQQFKTADTLRRQAEGFTTADRDFLHTIRIQV